MHRRILAAGDKTAAMDEQHNRRCHGFARRPDVEAQIVTVGAIAAMPDERGRVYRGKGLDPVRCRGSRIVHIPYAVPADRTLRQFKTLRRSSVGDRSEEHTSELQSLMRISYAVFCL